MFIKVFGVVGKLVVVICYGLWLLIEFGLVSGYCLILWLLLKIDLGNVGVEWIDVEVVVDGYVIISCKLGDILVFVDVVVKVLVV